MDIQATHVHLKPHTFFTVPRHILAIIRTSYHSVSRWTSYELIQILHFTSPPPDFDITCTSYHSRSSCTSCEQIWYWNFTSPTTVQTELILISFVHHIILAKLNLMWTVLKLKLPLHRSTKSTTTPYGIPADWNGLRWAWRGFHLSSCTAVNLSTFHLYTCPLDHLSICPPVHLSACPPVHTDKGDQFVCSLSVASLAQVIILSTQNARFVQTSLVFTARLSCPLKSVGSGLANKLWEYKTKPFPRWRRSQKWLFCARSARFVQN